MNMDHVPELWKELRLEFKDNLWKKYEELYDSLLEEDEPIIRNTIRNKRLNLGETDLRKIVKNPEKMVNKSGEIVKNPEKMVNKPEKMVNKAGEIVRKHNKSPKNPLKKIHCIIC
jgi:hypothetical protein